jgi:hypothetical protein
MVKQVRAVSNVDNTRDKTSCVSMDTLLNLSYVHIHITIILIVKTTMELLEEELAKLEFVWLTVLNYKTS